MRADGVTDGANVHAFLVLMSMRAPAESCVHEPALKYCTRSPLVVAWHGKHGDRQKQKYNAH